MNIAVLREEKKAALEILETKKSLVSGLEGKVEALRSDGSRLVTAGDHLQTKIDLYDEKLEAALLAAATTELQRAKDDLKRNADLAEVTEGTLKEDQEAMMREFEAQAKAGI